MDSSQDQQLTPLNDALLFVEGNNSQHRNIVKERNIDYLSIMPAELLGITFTNLQFQDLARCRRLSKSFRAFLSEEDSLLKSVKQRLFLEAVKNTSSITKIELPRPIFDNLSCRLISFICRLHDHQDITREEVDTRDLENGFISIKGVRKSLNHLDIENSVYVDAADVLGLGRLEVNRQFYQRAWNPILKVERGTDKFSRGHGKLSPECIAFLLNDFNPESLWAKTLICQPPTAIEVKADIFVFTSSASGSAERVSEWREMEPVEFILPCSPPRRSEDITIGALAKQLRQIRIDAEETMPFAGFREMNWKVSLQFADWKARL